MIQVVLSVILFLASVASLRAVTAGEIFKATGVQGGLVVHLGCGDGTLTAALHASDSYVVQGLDADAANVEAARQRLQAAGLYGKVSVERWTGPALPYADNLVNLLVAGDQVRVAPEEILRVLAPNGVAWVQQAGAWKKTVKPRPSTMDEWTHFQHDASGNAVSHDQLVAPPGRLQWLESPQHTRSHEHIPSINALVSSAGRLFYIIDEAPISSILQTPRWNLVARDAFNGVQLWQRPLDAWFPHIVNWGSTPADLQRRLVAIGDRVYATLGLHAPLSLLDAATGQTLKVYEQTEGADEVIYHQGTLLIAVRKVTPERKVQLTKWADLVKTKNSPVYDRDTAEPLVTQLKSTEARAPMSLVALDAESGRVLWRKSEAEMDGLKTLTLRALADHAYYQTKRDVVCVDVKTGRMLWTAPAPTLKTLCETAVVCADPQTVAALSPKTGAILWSQKSPLCDVKDAFVINGSLWLGGFKPFNGKTSGKQGPAYGPYFATQHDLATGRMISHIDEPLPGHHHRCWDNKATDRFILAGRRGVEFLDLQTKDVLWNSWVRGVCKYGIMPGNGLLYAPPHACGCYIEAKLTGFYVLAPAGLPLKAAPKTFEEFCEHGPAFGQIAALDASSSAADTWPTYRHDAARSGFSQSVVPAKLKPLWQTGAGGSISSPTIAGGRVVVASVEDHKVQAFDMNSGKPAWSFTAGARVDSAPTLQGGRVIFGCRDGSVYSLRATDGALEWRARAAHDDRQIAAFGQLESPSPVYGSVLVQDNVAYLTAGRSSYLDGGIDLCRLQLDTGKILSRTKIYSPDPETGRQPPQSGPSVMPGALADILSADNQYVYLRNSVYDRQGGAQPKGNPHLLTLTGYLDDSWAHRSYWIFGTKCSLSIGCGEKREKDLIYGRLMVFDKTLVYGYGQTNVQWSNQLINGPRRLFAASQAGGAVKWTANLPIDARAMVLAGKVLFVAGPAVDAAKGVKEDQPALLLAISTVNGAELARYPLASGPVFDGLAAVNQRLVLSTLNGQVLTFGASDRTEAAP